MEESDVRRAIRRGARTLEAVAQACEAGSGCGSCRPLIAGLIEEDAQRRARSPEAEILACQLGLFGDDTP